MGFKTSCSIASQVGLDTRDSFHTSPTAEQRPQRLPRSSPKSLVRQDSGGNEVIGNNEKEEWTAVLDKRSGGTYWWNQTTGKIGA